MTATPPRVAALVLAAGRSTRMAPHNKLLLCQSEGRAMVACVAAACAASRAAWVTVVTGHEADRVEKAVGEAALGVPVRFVHAPDYAAGLSASLRAGIVSLPDAADAAMVCLGDMPGVAAGMMDRLMQAYADADACRAAVPVWQGRRGNPVVWDRRCFAELACLSGDVGGRALLPRHAASVVDVQADGPGVLADCDTVEHAGLAGFREGQPIAELAGRR